MEVSEQDLLGLRDTHESRRGALKRASRLEQLLGDGHLGNVPRSLMGAQPAALNDPVGDPGQDEQ